MGRAAGWSRPQHSHFPSTADGRSRNSLAEDPWEGDEAQGQTRKGYVLREKGDAAWADIPASPPGPMEAIIHPAAVAACTTDVHLIETAALPAALEKFVGHKGVGIIEVRRTSEGHPPR